MLARARIVRPLGQFQRARRRPLKSYLGARVEAIETVRPFTSMAICSGASSLLVTNQAPLSLISANYLPHAQLRHARVTAGNVNSVRSVQPAGNPASS